LNTAAYRPPSLSQRRRNRLTAKRNLLKRFWNTERDDSMDSKRSIAVTISKELTAKMNEALILEEDAVKTIEHCESSGNKLLDTEKGCFIGHLRIGIITYWVEYRKERDRFSLCNIYSHRLQIIEDE
jgi:hypothetical protein